MPVFINELTAEVEQVGSVSEEDHPVEETESLNEAEYELIQTLALIEQRRQRLSVD
jgi:hypothetical protein